MNVVRVYILFDRNGYRSQNIWNVVLTKHWSSRPDFSEVFKRGCHCLCIYNLEKIFFFSAHWNTILGTIYKNDTFFFLLWTLLYAPLSCADNMFNIHHCCLKLNAMCGEHVLVGFEGFGRLSHAVYSVFSPRYLLHLSPPSPTLPRTAGHKIPGMWTELNKRPTYTCVVINIIMSKTRKHKKKKERKNPVL